LPAVSQAVGDFLAASGPPEKAEAGLKAALARYHPAEAQALYQTLVAPVSPVLHDKRLVFLAPDRETVSRTVDLRGEQTETEVDVVLRNLAEGYYLKKITEEPRILANYVDLLHLYVMESDFGKASDILENALGVVFRHRGDFEGQKRLWSEIDRIVNVQYRYGDADKIRVAREAVRDALVKSRQETQWDVCEPYQYCIAALVALDQRQEARKLLAEAEQKFPNHKRLRGFARQLH